MSGNNLLIANNTFFDFVEFGINLQSSSNITLDGNLVGMIHPTNLAKSDSETPISGGILACAKDSSDYCSNIFILNNIVAGT